MAAKEDISSTEKLLNLIRKANHTTVETAGARGMPKGYALQPKGFAKFISFRKSVRVGVDFGNQNIRLVKIAFLSDQKHQLLDYLEVPFDADIDPQSPDFPLFLKTALSRFVTDSKQTEIWSTISSTNVDLKFLRIPKVARKQIPNAVFWTFKKETSFDEKESTFDFQLLGEVSIDGVPRYEVIAVAAPRREIDDMRSLFQKSGFPLKGITIVPFALQNLISEGIIQTRANDACTLFIGKDWSRIAIFSNGKLMLSRGIKAGMVSMIESLREKMEKTHLAARGSTENPKDPDIPSAAPSLPEIAFEEAKAIFEHFMLGGPRNPAFAENPPLRETDVLAMIQPALDRLIRQVERTLAHYRLHLAGAGVQQVFITGRLAENFHIKAHISRQLGYEMETINPFSAWNIRDSSIAQPETDSLRESFIPAVGMALSDAEKTPNLIFTYRDKEERSRFKRYNQIIFAATGILLLICVGFFLWQDHLYDQKKSELTRLQAEMNRLATTVDRNVIIGMVAQAKNQRHLLTEIAGRYKGSAVISEILSITPSRVQLNQITIEMEKEKKDKNIPANRVILDGIIEGDPLSFDADLAKYLVRLKDSPLLTNPLVMRRAREIRNDVEILHFTAQFDLG